jgi:hypothetical protein
MHVLEWVSIIIIWRKTYLHVNTAMEVDLFALNAYLQKKSVIAEILNMKIKLSSIKNDCILGEVLRDISFKKYLGCYSCFELEKGFKEIPESSNDVLIAKEVMNYTGKVQFHAYKNSKLNLKIFWFWDGDGILLFELDGKMLINSDCKSIYDWEEIECQEKSK